MKIDTSTITGFAEMTAEQKVEALLGLEVPEKVDMSGFVKKEVFDAKASEAADLSRKLKARMTDEEAAKAQADADRKELEDKYADLLRKSTIAEHTARYLGMPGYDEKLARDTAEALFDGNMEKVFENQQKASEAHEKKLKADLLMGTPKPGGGGDTDEKQENVKLAEALGKAKAASLKSSDDALKHYL